MKARTFLTSAAVLTLLSYCVLGFYQTSSAQTEPKGPFANSVEQRQDTVRLLGEIRDLLKEQNALLKSGQLKVVVQPEKK